MTEVLAMQGSLRFVCEDFSGVKQHEIFHNFYGQTPGELLDNLLVAASKVTSDTEDWLLDQPDSDYSLLDDNWKMYLVMPDPSKKTEAKLDLPVYSVKHVMISAVVWRRFFMSLWIKHTSSKLRKKNRIKLHAAFENHPKYKDPGLVSELPHDMSEYGISGSEYDELTKAITEHKIPKELLSRVLTGSIVVSAQDSDKQSIFYSDTRMCYGHTTGEILDNLVELSIDSANAVQTWQIMNRDSSYSMKNDYWYTVMKFPDSRKTSGYAAAGASFKSIRQIVRITVLHRDVAIRHMMAFEEFCLGGRGFTDEQIMPPKAVLEFKDISDAKTFLEMKNFGLLGSDYDSYLLRAASLKDKNSNRSKLR